MEHFCRARLQQKKKHGHRRARRGVCRANRKQKKTDVKPPLGIFNLSAVHLSPEGINILNKGLKFAPKARLNKFQTQLSEIIDVPHFKIPP